MLQLCAEIATCPILPTFNEPATRIGAAMSVFNIKLINEDRYMTGFSTISRYLEN